MPSTTSKVPGPLPLGVTSEMSSNMLTGCACAWVCVLVGGSDLQWQQSGVISRYDKQYSTTPKASYGLTWETKAVFLASTHHRNPPAPDGFGCLECR